MKNFEKKEIDLDKLLNKLNNLNLSYTHLILIAKHLAKKEITLNWKKEELKKKKMKILFENMRFYHPK